MSVAKLHDLFLQAIQIPQDAIKVIMHRFECFTSLYCKATWWNIPQNIKPESRKADTEQRSMLCLLFCDRLCASWPLQLDPTPCMRQTANLHQQAAWLFCRSHKELGHRRSGSTRTADACNPPMKPTKQKHLAAFVFQFLSPQASRKKTNTSCKPFFHPHLLVLIQSQLWIT